MEKPVLWVIVCGIIAIVSASYYIESSHYPNLSTISLANATKTYDKAYNTLVAELHNPNYSGSFTVPLLEPIYPTYFKWDGRLYVLENSSGLKAGVLNVAYNVETNGTPNISKSYPIVINAYVSQFNAMKRTTYGVAVCPNKARNWLLNALNNESNVAGYFAIETECGSEQYLAYVVG